MKGSLVLRRIAPLLALAWGTCALPAVASTPGEALPSGTQIRWLLPTTGTRVTAGELLDLSWSADGGSFARLGVEEWEAFASLDGGKTFRLRLTPHLQISQLRFAWRVPEDLQGEVQLLIRFGDEREEYSFEPGVRVFIDPAPAPRRAVELTEPTPAVGESARPGEPGVIEWDEGGRDGTGLRRKVTRRPLEPFATSAIAAHLSAGFAAPPQPGLDLLPPLAAVRSFQTPDRAGRPSALAEPRRSIRLLIHRFNE